MIFYLNASTFVILKSFEVKVSLIIFLAIQLEANNLK